MNTFFSNWFGRIPPSGVLAIAGIVVVGVIASFKTRKSRRKWWQFWKK